MSSAEAKNQAINFLSPSETGKEIAATDKSPKSQADLFANAARDKVFEVAGRAGETANAAKDSIGAGLETVGEDLSKSVLGDGTFSDMAKSIACKIENSGT